MSDFDRYSLTIARWLAHVHDAGRPAQNYTTPGDATADCTPVGYSADVNGHAVVIWASGRRPTRWFLSQQRDRDVVDVVETSARSWRGGVTLFVQPVPHGYVIATSHCAWRSEGPDLDAVVIDGDGQEVTVGTIGGGINHLQATSGGDIWVGYSDEGVYRTSDWSNNPGAWGLARFGSSLNKTWDYTPRSRTDESAPKDVIDDCYVLNVTDEQVTAYTYSNFPIIQVRPGDDVKVRRTNIQFADDVLIDGQVCAFLGGYGKEATRVSIGELDEKSYQEHYSGRLDIDRRPSTLSWAVVISRGKLLSRFFNRTWSRWQLDVEPPT